MVMELSCGRTLLHCSETRKCVRHGTNLASTEITAHAMSSIRPDEAIEPGQPDDAGYSKGANKQAKDNDEIRMS